MASTATIIEVGGECRVKERGKTRTVRVLRHAWGRNPRWFRVLDVASGKEETISERRLH